MALITETPDKLPTAQTQPLIPAAKVKIVGGMSQYALENPPEVGDERTYIVKGICKKHHIDRVDGEDRLVVDIEHTSIYERGKVPIVDEQPALFGESEEEREARVAEKEVAAEYTDAPNMATDPALGDPVPYADGTEPIDPPEAEAPGKPSIFSDNEV